MTRATLTAGRIAWLAAIVVVGLVVGFTASSAIGGRRSSSEAAQPETVDSQGPSSSPIPSGAPRSPGDTPTTSSTLGPPRETPETLLAWTAGGLPPGFAKQIDGLEGLGQPTIVRGEFLAIVATETTSGAARLNLTDGWLVPVDVLAVDPGPFSRFAEADDRSLLEGLQEGQAVLTKTSAELRGIGQGGTIEFAGGEILDVVGVVSDQSGAGAEIVVDLNSGTALGVIVDRFLLARLTGQRSTVEASLRGVLDPSAPLRVRTSGESPFLRHGDAVLTQAAIKSAFGEFSYRLAEGRSVELDPAWVADNIVDEEVPLLGTVTCHRDFIPALSQALARIESDNLGHLIDPTQFAGCFSPRRIGAGLPLSHHAWGVAIDLNIGDNPRGSFSTQDPSLVAALTDVGMGWGGEWLVPDPGHYEVISP